MINKSVFSFLLRLTMRRCSHLLLSTSHAAGGISRPQGPQQQTDTASEWWDWWTDRQMLDSFIDCSVLCKKVARTRFPSMGFRSWSRFLAVSLQFTWIINLTVRCHYFPPGLQLPPQPLRGLLPISLLGEQRHDGCEVYLRLLSNSIAAAIWTQALLHPSHANHSATEPPYLPTVTWPDKLLEIDATSPRCECSPRCCLLTDYLLSFFCCYFNAAGAHHLLYAL